MKYSVTTVSLPDLTFDEQCSLLQRLGYDGVELRARRVSDDLRAKAVPSNWGYHVNDVTPENLSSRASVLKAVLEDHGLQLAGLATNMPCTDLEQFKHALDGAVAIGAPLIRLGAARGFRGKEGESYREIYGETLAGFARCVELARGTGIRMIIETHNGTIHPSVSFACRIAQNFSPKEVGIIYDPQNMVQDGFETTELAFQLMGDYLAHCHFGAHRPVAGEADANGTVHWTWQACRLCEGLFDFPLAMKWLKKTDYKGYITVEDFRGDVNHEIKYRDAIDYLKKLEAAC